MFVTAYTPLRVKCFPDYILTPWLKPRARTEWQRGAWAVYLQEAAQCYRGIWRIRCCGQWLVIFLQLNKQERLPFFLPWLASITHVHHLYIQHSLLCLPFLFRLQSLSLWNMITLFFFRTRKEIADVAVSSQDKFESDIRIK